MSNTTVGLTNVNIMSKAQFDALATKNTNELYMTPIAESWTSGTSWYKKFADGLIIQSVRTGVFTNRTTKTLTFPIAFTTNCYGLSFMVERDTSSNPPNTDDMIFTTTNRTNTSVTVYPFDAGDNTYNCYARYIAIGY